MARTGLNLSVITFREDIRGWFARQEQKQVWTLD